METFGLAASFHQFISFTPMINLSAVIGFVLRIKRTVLFLYKLSMLLEQCVLLSGYTLPLLSPFIWQGDAGSLSAWEPLCQLYGIRRYYLTFIYT